MSERVVLCEGYYDRAFWAGWIEHLGCPPPDDNRVFDPAGKRVTGGHYGYYSAAPANNFIRIVPCGGRQNLLPEARRRLADRHVAPFERLVICADADTTGDEGARFTGLRREDVLAEVRKFDSAAELNANGDMVLDNGSRHVALVRWETDADGPGIPAKQTLERLVCASIAAVYPDRGPAIQSWLDDRPGAPTVLVKEYAWSHMAGWYAERGCDAFYRAIWSDEAVAAELQRRLTETRAWAIAASLL